MKSVIVTGGKGQLGSCFNDIKDQHPGLKLHLLNKDQLDITKLDWQLLDTFNPDFIVNCAAYTAVDKAESEIDLSMKINGLSLDQIAKYSSARKIPLLHYSTDYVYHNGQKAPLQESDTCSPKSIYGKSKLAGEKVIIDHTSLHVIMRVSWLYSPFQNNFMKTMLRLFRQRPELNIVNDQMGCPTSALQLAKDSLNIIESYFNSPYDFAFGVYNYTHLGYLSWFDFAMAIKLYVEAETTLNAIPTTEYPTPAERPLQSRMRIDRVMHAFELQPSNWKNCLWENLEHPSTKDYIDTL